MQCLKPKGEIRHQMRCMEKRKAYCRNPDDFVAFAELTAKILKTKQTYYIHIEIDKYTKVCIIKDINI